MALSIHITQVGFFSCGLLSGHPLGQPPWICDYYFVALFMGLCTVFCAALITTGYCTDNFLLSYVRGSQCKNQMNVFLHFEKMKKVVLLSRLNKGH